MSSALLAAWLGAALAAPQGFRYDGRSTAEATPPTAWTPTWKAPLGARGNGSVVVTGTTAFVTAEPDRLVAVDLNTGRVKWDRHNRAIDAIDPGIAAPIRDLIDQADGWEGELTTLKSLYAKLLRDARSGASSDPTQLTTTQARIAQLTSTLDAIAPYRTPSTHDEVGYASPTPVTDGTSVWVTFGNGVVSSYKLDGTLRWTRWLGPCVTSKHGYNGVDAASPVLVDGLLAVPYRSLQGLDAATGASRWTGPAWPHYGSPTVARGGGKTWLLTPDGMAVDAATGAVGPTGLGNLNYTSPVTAGDRVWYLGTNARYDEVAPNWAIAWRLTSAGAEKLYKVELPTNDRLYSVPVLVGERLFAVTRQKQLVVVNASTGAAEHSAPLASSLGEVWAPLIYAGGKVWATAVNGTVFAIDASPPFAVSAQYEVAGNASTPWFQGGAVLWRGTDALYLFGR